MKDDDVWLIVLSMMIATTLAGLLVSLSPVIS